MCTQCNRSVHHVPYPPLVLYFVTTGSQTTGLQHFLHGVGVPGNPERKRGRLFCCCYRLVYRVLLLYPLLLSSKAVTYVVPVMILARFGR